MARKIYVIILLLLAITGLRAGNVDLQTARQVATGFIHSRMVSLNATLLPSSADYTVSLNDSPVYYIVNLNPKGFIIVPAIDAAPPVLGYSFENNYSPYDQPENFSYWMDGYAKIIADLQEKNVNPTPDDIAAWQLYLTNKTTRNASTVTSVGPLLTCLWNQSYPYNYLCPVDPNGSGGHVYAGCVATAMSQVMYYWRFPQQGTGSHGYSWYPYGYLFADFGNTTYNWEEMLNSSNTPNFEMAQLQLHLGISVDMMYGGSGSGAYSTDAVTALKNYFGYDQSLELVYRNDYSYENWKSLLTTQIDAGQPMYYHGFGTGGHAFNVDGYQDTMYFHFNWGWGSSYNGYFHLFNLNPGGNTFTEGQGAIINFIPAGNNNVVQCGTTDTLTMLAGTIEDGSGPVSPYFNNSACSWLIMPGDTLENIKLTFHRFDLEAGKDYLYVYDGMGNDAPLIGSYTGNQTPGVVTATSGSMFIQFVTDGSGTTNGWFASYNAKQAPFCSSGVTNITAPSGSLSDGSGSFNYRDKSICRYKLQPAGAQSISITFNEFSTAGEGDYLEIYNLENQALLHKLYGQTNPGTLNFSTGKLYIVFVTDQENSSSGWSFSYISSELTGLNESKAGANISLFPNPAQNLLKVSINNADREYTLNLISSKGATVFTQTLNSVSGNIESSIDVSTFPRGIYILQLNSAYGTSYHKLVLN